MSVKDWLVSVALKKAVGRIVQLGLSWVLAQQPERFGVTVNPEVATASAFGGLEVLRNYLKVKLGWKWLW